jgi:hypothetical protein
MSELVYGTSEQLVEQAEPIEELVIPNGDWPEYRKFVGQIRCVVCQHSRGIDADGNNVEEVSYKPELIRVADVHHLTSRGAGGDDAENIVPLCRVHHGEFHSMGVNTFQLHYNVDLRFVARAIYARFMDQIDGEEYAQIALAKHQQILSRVSAMDLEILDLGNMILEFRESRLGGKRLYEWLGFISFDQWITAPRSGSGLGISLRTSWRYQNFAGLIRDNPTQEKEIMSLGIMKANTISSMMKDAGDDEKEEIVSRAKSSSMNDLISWKNQKEGKADPREELNRSTADMIFDLLNSFGVYEADDEKLKAWAWKLMRHIDVKRFDVSN